MTFADRFVKHHSLNPLTVWKHFQGTMYTKDTNVLLTLLSAVNCRVGRLIISQVIRDVRKLLYTPLLTIHVLQNAILERTTNTNRSMTWLERDSPPHGLKPRSKIIERSTAEEGRLGCLRPRAHCPQPRWRLLA